MIRESLSHGKVEDSTGFRWRASDVSRIEGFSDAVFGFALALLVVSSTPASTGKELFAALKDMPAFGLTFTILIWFWHGHYIFFRRYGLTDTYTIFLNATFLFLILFFVYPLKFLFSSLLEMMAFGGTLPFSEEDSSLILTLYSAGFVAITMMFALLYRHAWNKREALELSPREIMITRASLQANVILSMIGIASATLAFFGPAYLNPVAGMIYILIGPVTFIHWVRAERKWKNLD